MSKPQYARSEALLGEGATDRLSRAHVAVFGLGGVGSYLCEALARMGVGHLTLVDGDLYSETNLNRQLYATRDTVGQPKVEVAAERIATIDPDIAVTPLVLRFAAENAESIPFSSFDYIADAIDDVKAKVALAQAADRFSVPIVMAMGAGNKLDPTAFRVADIAKTQVCPLARAMRRELRAVGIEHLKVVYSEEPPRAPTRDEEGHTVPASCSFVPSVMGLIMAGEIIKDLLERHE